MKYRKLLKSSANRKKNIQKMQKNSWFQKPKKLLKSSKLMKANVLSTAVTLIARHSKVIKNHAAGIVVLGSILDAITCQVGGIELVISAPIPTHTM